MHRQLSLRWFGTQNMNHGAPALPFEKLANSVKPYQRHLAVVSHSAPAGWDKLMLNARDVAAPTFGLLQTLQQHSSLTIPAPPDRLAGHRVTLVDGRNYADLAEGDVRS